MTSHWWGVTRGGAARVALANGPVGRVVLGFAGITLGEWVLGTSVAIAAYRANGALAVALVGFRFVPAAIAGVLLGGLQRRVSRARILTGVAAGRASCAVLAMLAFSAGAPFGVVLALVWLDSVIGSTYRPAQAALLPSLVNAPAELTASTTLLSNAKTSSQVLGALAGGLLVAGVSVEGALAVAAALYLTAGVATVGLPRRAVSRSHGWRTLDGIAAAGRLLREDSVAARVVGYSGLRSLIRGLWVTLAVIASLRILDLGDAGFGLLMAAAGAGAILSIPTSTLLAFRPQLARWLAVSLVLSGLAVSLVGVTASGAAAVVLMVTWGAAMSFSDVTASALLYRVVHGRHIGPVTAFMESGKLLFEGLGALVAPVLVAALSVRSAVVVAGMTVPAVVALDVRAFPRIDRSATRRAALLNLVHGAPLFAPLRVDALEAIVAQLTAEDVAAGHVVIHEGDRDGDDYFLVELGAFEVLIDGYLVAVLGPGQGFGELALLRNAPRAATVRATEASLVHRLSRAHFLAAVGGLDAVEAAERVEVAPADPLDALGRLPLLRGLGRETLNVLVASGSVVEYAPGTAITTKGAIEDTCHVVLSGEAEVVIDGRRRRGLQAGDLFGEIAVLHRRPRLATVVAVGAVAVLTIPGAALRAGLEGRDDPVGALAMLA